MFKALFVNSIGGNIDPAVMVPGSKICFDQYYNYEAWIFSHLLIILGYHGYVLKSCFKPDMSILRYGFPRTHVVCLYIDYVIKTCRWDLLIYILL